MEEISKISVNYKRGILKVNGKKVRAEIIVGIQDEKNDRWVRRKIFNLKKKHNEKKLDEIMISYIKNQQKV